MDVKESDFRGLNITFGDLSLAFLLKRCADASQACRGR